MKKIALLSAIFIFTLSLTGASIFQNAKRPAESSNDKSAFYCTTPVAPTSVTVNHYGSYIQVFWSGGSADAYTVGGYSDCGPFEYTCQGGPGLTIPVCGHGNLRVKAVCGPCNAPYSVAFSAPASF